MEARGQCLSQIQAYIEDVDKEVTMILQSLQWDRKHLLESAPLAVCNHDSRHRVPLATKAMHEAKCVLKNCGYDSVQRLLPDPPDDKASTLVTFSKEDIYQIIENAARRDPMFKRGARIEDVQPLTVERLQSTYTADERRAIHDAVVSVAPTIRDASELALAGGEDVTPSRERSRVEVLAELRDMKRRRTKYRTAARTTKYSDALRDVIKTQMDLYCEALGVDMTCDNDDDNARNQEDVNTISTKNNSTRHRERSKKTKDAYSDDKYTRNSKDDTRVKHKHRDNRKEYYDNRNSNYDYEDRKGRQDDKRKRHHNQDRDNNRQSKPESYEYRLDREIKKEPEDNYVGHSGKSYEDRSREQSTSQYRNDRRYKDSQRHHNKDNYSNTDRSERSSKSTNRYRGSERHRRSDDFQNRESKRKYDNDREDVYIRYCDIKREKSEENALEDNVKRKKY